MMTEGRFKQKKRKVLQVWPGDAVIRLLALLVPAAVIAVYTGLIPLGKWYPDEYDTYLHFRELGVTFLVERMLHWSYRPFSELLIYAYSQAVLFTGSQLMTRFLGSLWLILVTVVCLPVVVRLRKDGVRAAAPYFSLALVVIVLFLSSKDIGEVFYWPQGSAAYLPALACLGFITFHLSIGDEGGFAETMSVALVLAVLALSVEVGAVIATLYVLVFAALGLIWPFIKNGPTVLRRADLGLAIALIAALPVFYFVLNGRMAGTAELFGDAAIAKHLFRSLWEALKRFPADGLGLKYASDEPLWFFATLLAKILLFLGALNVFRSKMVQSGVGQRRLLKLIAWLIALLGGSLFSLLAAFYQFGLICCERHQTTRECLVILAIIVAAKLAALLRPKSSVANPRQWAALLLVGATIFAAAANASALLSDYAHYSVAWNARNSTWLEGMSDKTSMVFKQPPILRVVGGQEWPIGQYDREPEPVLTIRVILDYFGKTHLDMRPAGEP